MNNKENNQELIQKIDQVLASATSKWSEEDIVKLKQVKAGLESLSTKKDLIKYAEILAKLISGGGSIALLIAKMMADSPDS